MMLPPAAIPPAPTAAAADDVACRRGAVGGDGADSDSTDPDMPELEPVSPSLSFQPPARAPQETARLHQRASWQALPPRPAAKAVRRKRAVPGHLSAAEAAAEASLARAEELLGSPQAASSEGKARKLRAITLLHGAVGLGCTITVEAAVRELLELLKDSDHSLLQPALRALSTCREFPVVLAADAARQLMLRRSWPEHWDSLRDLCRAVAAASRGPVLGACLELVPRARSPDMLGFDLVVEPLIAALVAEAEGEDFSRAVVLLCDDLGGPAPRSGPARRLLQQLAAAAGEGAVTRPIAGPSLAKKAHLVRAQDRLAQVFGGA